MSQKYGSNYTSMLLVFLLMFRNLCDAERSTGGATRPPDGQKGDGSAFFALRSCHQLLQGDGGEFFSPDYLCSNPPLWCNWTIQVDPGKRIHLRLEDLTPDETCELKQDQIHIDEPAGHSGGHKVLQKCWQEAKYTSSSNTLYVVLLIGGWPRPTYRGFYGRYQAFGQPVVYNPKEGFTGRSKESKLSSGLMDFSDFDSAVNSEQSEVANSDVTYDYYDQHLTMRARQPWGTGGAERLTDLGKMVQNLHPSTANHSQAYQFVASPTLSTSTPRTFRAGRGVTHSFSNQADSAAGPKSSQQHPGGLKPSHNDSTAARDNAVEGRNTEDGNTPSVGGSMKAEGKRLEVSQTSDQLPDGSGPQNVDHDHHHHHPNGLDLPSDHRGSLNLNNHTETPHLPGDHLSEVAVEVNFSQDSEETWDNLARLLLSSVKSLIKKQLDILHTHVSLSSKRIKRLNAGALYILWLKIGQGPGGVQIHRAVHSAMQGLLTPGVSLQASDKNAVIMSVSTADVNECGTQLVMCDFNADCVNQFGTYSCHCRPGFQDESRVGSGGTVCMESQDAGCTSGLTSESKGVYVLFFLLSFLILTLMVVAGTLYHRHHRGTFLVRCNSRDSISPPDPNNNHHLHSDDSYSTPTECDLPPPPPARGIREGWVPVKEHCPSMDLTLLRFNSLLPPDGYIDPKDKGKM
ncbi:uncharacterized protein zgc:66455 isoform X1 [Nothobranchius furzeri]|uniref:LOC107382281-like protein n=3 Tax=Nothobranchius furzeri TaxID=105023 RepID=A0A8C6PWJ1_NOTFU|nr:putative LOC107382281-like protein [Nothobranchius furzeri]